jgi:hypothetical protein
MHAHYFARTNNISSAYYHMQRRSRSSASSALQRSHAHEKHKNHMYVRLSRLLALHVRPSRPQGRGLAARVGCRCFGFQLVLIPCLIAVRVVVGIESAALVGVFGTLASLRLFFSLRRGVRLVNI